MVTEPTASCGITHESFSTLGSLGLRRLGSLDGEELDFEDEGAVGRDAA
jgi:hypothetical protein